MSSDICFNLKIEGFTCTVISDGYIAVPKRITVGNQEYENMDISCLLVRSKDITILIDTGCGSEFQDTAGKLVENLSKSGVKPEDIAAIIFTHGHGDHVAGTFDIQGNAVFPNARYIVARKEWECWEQEAETPLNEGLFRSARKNLLPIREKFELIEDNAEVFPGIRLLPARGHTLGGVVVRIGSEKEKLFCIGDLIHSFSEFDDPRAFSFLDSAPEDAVTLRTDWLAEKAEDTSLLFACHFPFPGIGHIVNDNGKLGWRSI